MKSLNTWQSWDLVFSSNPFSKNVFLRIKREWVLIQMCKFIQEHISEMKVI